MQADRPGGAGFQHWSTGAAGRVETLEAFHPHFIDTQHCRIGERGISSRRMGQRLTAAREMVRLEREMTRRRPISDSWARRVGVRQPVPVPGCAGCLRRITRQRQAAAQRVLAERRAAPGLVSAACAALLSIARRGGAGISYDPPVEQRIGAAIKTEPARAPRTRFIARACQVNEWTKSA